MRDEEKYKAFGGQWDRLWTSLKTYGRDDIAKIMQREECWNLVKGYDIRTIVQACDRVLSEETDVPAPATIKRYCMDATAGIPTHQQTVDEEVDEDIATRERNFHQKYRRFLELPEESRKEILLEAEVKVKEIFPSSDGKDRIILDRNREPTRVKDWTPVNYPNCFKNMIMSMALAIWEKNRWKYQQPTGLVEP